MQLKINQQFDKSLKQLATEQGFAFGDRPSPTGLIEAIAAGKLTVVSPPERSKVELEVLNRICKKQPFRLSYLDAAGAAFVFDCVYAQVGQYEGKEYLEIKYINDVDSDSPPPLNQNRCLRLDRIPLKSRIVDLEAEWAEGLNYIEVKFELYGNLAYAFSKKETDIIEPIKTGVIVTRQISNDFWFLRTILRYGRNCKLLAPDYLVEKLKKTLAEMTKNYS